MLPFWVPIFDSQPPGRKDRLSSPRRASLTSVRVKPPKAQDQDDLGVLFFVSGAFSGLLFVIFFDRGERFGPWRKHGTQNSTLVQLPFAQALEHVEPMSICFFEGDPKWWCSFGGFLLNPAKN